MLIPILFHEVIINKCIVIVFISYTVYNPVCWGGGGCNRTRSGRVTFFPINAPGMGRFQLLNFGVLGYGLELRFSVVIAIIASLTLTITLKLNFSRYPSIHTNYIISHCTTL